MKSKVLAVGILMCISLVAFGAGTVISYRQELEERKRDESAVWEEWQVSLSEDLPRYQQHDWRQGATRWPDAMMRACSFQVDPPADPEN